MPDLYWAFRYLIVSTPQGNDGSNKISFPGDRRWIWQAEGSQILLKAVGRFREEGLLVWRGGLENARAVHSGYRDKVGQPVSGWEGQAL